MWAWPGELATEQSRWAGMKQVEGARWPPLCLPKGVCGMPRGNSSLGVTAIALPVPVGAEKWQKRSECLCGSGPTQARACLSSHLAHLLDQHSGGF